MRHRLRVPTVLPAALLGLALAVSSSPAAAQDGGAPSLYERMGGYDVVAAVVDDFFARFDADPELQPFLEHVTEPARVRQHFVDFLCARAGGPCAYHGGDMDSVHAEMAIAGEHFDRVTGHFGDAIAAAGVDRPEREELLALLRSLRGPIVQGGS